MNKKKSYITNSKKTIGTEKCQSDSIFFFVLLCLRKYGNPSMREILVL